MNQNQTLDSDLQRAIDDITKTTSVDPVFSDPVAAPSSVPEGDDGMMGEPIGPFPAPEPVTPESPIVPELPVAPEPPVMPELPVMPEPIVNQEPVYAPTVPVEPAPVYNNYANNYSNVTSNMQQVRESALRDLAPILDKMNVNPAQKFRIYRDMFEDLRDYTVLEPAYRAAKGIVDERERGEALLYLIEAIDRM